jgi:ribose transport system ATP-binding protein
MNSMDQSNGKPILSMQQITKRFPGVVALDQVSFECQRGEVHALVGENGAGKSTLMKILSGAYQPDAGQIVLRGEAEQFKHPSDSQQAGISIIYQELNLLVDRTVAQNIFLGREIVKRGFIDHREMERQTIKLLQDLDVNVPPRTVLRQLSVAQQQQIEIVKALALNAEILVMDEPSASLAPQEVENLFKLVQRLKEHGVTIIYISHRLDEIFQIADRVTVLKDGQVVGTHDVASIDSDQLVHMMVGRVLDAYYPPNAQAEEIGEVVLEASDISADHDLPGINLQIRTGEIVGLAGLEGSGRTHLARMLFGVTPLARGSMKLDGKKVRIRSPQEAIQNGMGYVTEDRKLEGLVLIESLQKNVALPSLDKRQRYSFVDRESENEVVLEVIQTLDLRTANVQQEVQFLSGGNQQKAVLAKWLVTEAKVIIFDEPTRGIDVGAKAGIHQLMRRLAASGKAILMISSELPEIVGMSDRVIVMNKGRLITEFAGDVVTESMILQAIANERLQDIKANNQKEKADELA